MAFNSFERASANFPEETALYILIYFKLLTLSNIDEIVDTVKSFTLTIF